MSGFVSYSHHIGASGPYYVDGHALPGGGGACVGIDNTSFYAENPAHLRAIAAAFIKAADELDASRKAAAEAVSP